MYTRLFLSAILCCNFTGCENLENPDEGIEAEAVFSVAKDKDKIPADSVSGLTITVTLEEQSDPNKEVTFSTDYGRFVGVSSNGENVTPQMFKVKASSRTAEARLISGTKSVREVGIIVAVGTFRKLLTVSFEPALAEDLFIISDKLKLKADRTETATLTVQLVRNEGKVSEGTAVTFTVQPKAGSAASAEVTPLSFATHGIATAKLRSISASPGIITVKAEVTLRDQTKKAKEMDVEFLPSAP